MAPDLRRKVDANRAARVAQERALTQQIEAQVSTFQCALCHSTRPMLRRTQAGDPEAAKPIWADPRQ